ncbi:MAG: nucleic acid-binding protein [Methanobrevibacter sp.]|uniref:nucleic acid-binding protein n=1 Tax=Methanobrevibacter sp. TaxID=66852 RepID=UPI00260145EB|nr:nucleic acid-binding protein [Methanobrevibacter sp.]MBR0271083.1 nucleic acid-binding protein [Methanobrevibacter sp.]
MTKPIFYDTDCLSSFLQINRIDLLKKEYSKIIISDKVKSELYNKNTPDKVKKRLTLLIQEGYVEIKDLELGSEEFDQYYEFITDDKTEDIGKGELSIISLAITKNGILASNNLDDVCYFVKKYNLEHVTTSKIIVTCYEKGYLTFDEADNIWKKLLKNPKHPQMSFKDFYNKDDKMCYN